MPRYALHLLACACLLLATSVWFKEETFLMSFIMFVCGVSVLIWTAHSWWQSRSLQFRQKMTATLFVSIGCVGIFFSGVHHLFGYMANGTHNSLAFKTIQSFTGESHTVFTAVIGSGIIFAISILFVVGGWNALHGRPIAKPTFEDKL